MTAPLLARFDLGDGDAKTLATYSGNRLTLIPDSGSTVSFSKVDQRDATMHDSATVSEATVESTITVDWPYYHLTSSGGTTRVGLVGT